MKWQDAREIRRTACYVKFSALAIPSRLHLLTVYGKNSEGEEKILRQEFSLGR